ncbi:OmpH family outer membrane protein [Magnetospirillum sp. SS-4]|uniref:OmpH family outer membrane protein n=1 Tax=Magnetospirillum sp. SS-4 TaxID=2681465 RepID=UPI0013811810|nr:OmpH family outer membrane protein [Magnetospirillum sp. SS-4]CAA7617052.1 Outer membrane protein [Magnetospirillum sp. SS-4]
MRAWLAAAALAVATVTAGPALAQKAPAAAPVSIIIVDVQAAQRESLAGKALLAQRDKYQQSFQHEFNTARQQLQAADQELAKQKGGLTQEAYERKAKELEQRVIAFQRRTQVAVRALDKSTELAGAELMNGILGITGEIASEMGANLVLPKQQVVLHEPRMDVTGLVIERLNRRMSTINFPVPVVDEPAQAPAGTKPGRK